MKPKIVWFSNLFGMEELNIRHLCRNLVVSPSGKWEDFLLPGQKLEAGPNHPNIGPAVLAQHIPPRLYGAGAAHRASDAEAHLGTVSGPPHGAASTRYETVSPLSQERDHVCSNLTITNSQWLLMHNLFLNSYMYVGIALPNSEFLLVHLVIRTMSSVYTRELSLGDI